ncbi:PilN domain-containing protein [Fictibacillus sp. KU28468]|uniref:PilN domain-containing protein n=1 Tax=Fictibacillus sp. KU28468 TaxID=2991053 RepID=UPI00223CEC93|nr:hypothetical protein [Fictibacillus sp. KU28468]UZJ80420.1 hypothetical protein OKX00_08180 [Fictibacillus sp. KU28468]
MLVDINLLPRKERTTFSSKLLSIGVLALLLLGSIWLGVDYYLAKQEVNQTRNDLKQEKQMADIQKQNAISTNPAVASAPLQEKIDYIKGMEIPAAELLQHLVSFLPERGYFITYKYDGGKDISIAVQFDTLPDSAQYLHELSTSPNFTDAELEKVESKKLETDDLKGEKNILPRYLATYKLTLNEAAFKDLKDGGKQ